MILVFFVSDLSWIFDTFRKTRVHTSGSGNVGSCQNIAKIEFGNFKDQVESVHNQIGRIGRHVLRFCGSGAEKVQVSDFEWTRQDWIFIC